MSQYQCYSLLKPLEKLCSLVRWLSGQWDPSSASTTHPFLGKDPCEHARLFCVCVCVGGGRWLKEAAQAEREGEGLSGGRCSMTNLTTPHHFFYSSSLWLVHWEQSKLAQEQTLVHHFPLFSYLPLLAFIQPPYPPDLIYPPQIAAFSFNPSFFFAVSSVCCPDWTTRLCGLKT